MLKEVAEHNMSVLTDPAPSVLFLDFGDSSLDFELRVWIRDFLDRKRIQSELNQAIDSRFRSEGIEIPFPQRDLHVRSVDKSPGSILTPPGVQRPDLVVVPSKEKDEDEEED